MAVVSEIHADPGGEVHRVLRIDILDADGRPATVFNGAGEKIPPVHHEPVTLKLMAPELMVITQPIRFGVMLMPAGDYQFKFALDNEPVGEPMDIAVMSSR
jgi:hypothetical protein